MYIYTQNMNTKKNTREQIQELFLKQDRKELDAQDQKASQEILDYTKKNGVQNMCIYESMTDEVGTRQLIASLRAAKIKVFTPQMIGETELILIDEDYEPYEKEIDLFIVPGRAFTQSGKRLGRGKWYYDRFLSQKIYKKSKKIGVCYGFQLLQDLQTEKHDINMDLIFSQ